MKISNYFIHNTCTCGFTRFNGVDSLTGYSVAAWSNDNGVLETVADAVFGLKKFVSYLFVAFNLKATCNMPGLI